MKPPHKNSALRRTRAQPAFRLTPLVWALAVAFTSRQVVAATLPVACNPCSNGATFIQPNTGTVVTTTQTATNLTINQASQTAILNWQSFNIGQGGSVNFVQPNSNASALNKIWDANPSMIAGSLTANGQIYLVNHNGIVFANGAQVNAAALVASSLDIDDALYQNGYLTNTRVKPAFSGVGGFVRVDTGATLNGSRIMLFAPVVENSGNIVTRDSADGQSGQVVMAAGHRVYLEASTDPNLRGVLVEVDVDTPGAADPALNGQVATNQLGTVSNLGKVLAAHGNITLAGYAVNQQGRLSATTSVTQNGSIKLLARYNVAPETATNNLSQSAKDPQGAYYDIRATQTGVATLAAGSVTEVLPELDNTATTTDGQGFNPSIVEVMGKTVNVQGATTDALGNIIKGGMIVAPGGMVTVAAMSKIDPAVGANGQPGIGVYQEIPDNNASYKPPYSSFLNPHYKPTPVVGDTARVFLGSGSSIDVSGSTAAMPVSRNILTVELRGTQFQDAPLQRNGFLWGKKVKVDMRQGTTLANYLSDEALLARNVAERTTAGGKVLLASTGDVVTKSGSSINLSGGQINYTAGFIGNTTLTSQGVAYDIATADPNRIYDGIVGTYTVKHAKWGVTETFLTPGAPDKWDPGYVEGKAAGSVTVLAPHAALNGTEIANTVAGPNQRQVYVDLAAAGQTASYKNTWQMLPQGGALVLGDNSAIADINTGIKNFITDSNVNLQASAAVLPTTFAVTDVLPASFMQTTAIDPGLFKANSGPGLFAVYSNKTVSLDAATSLDFSVGGVLTLKADTLNILGSVNAPAGAVNLDTALTTGSQNLTAGAINIGSAGTPAMHISTRGRWTNDASETTAAGVPAVPDLTAPALPNGGAISINSGSDLLVAPGTMLDASGGAWIDARKKIHGGNGGAIQLSSGAPADATTVYKTQLDGLDLRSYGVAGGKGGALKIKAGDVIIGGTGTAANTLALASGFFQRGGFSSYNVSAQGFGGLTVAAGAVIAPLAQSLMLNPDAVRQATGTDMYSLAQAALLPDWQRSPVSLTLSQSNKINGALTIGDGALVKVDPKASITLSAAKQLTVLGTLDAPAGAINLILTTAGTAFDSGRSTIWLGGKSRLLSRGTTLLTPNAQNLVQGQVLAGGNIKITSNMMVLAQQGSLMDVSGTAADLDLVQGYTAGSVIYRNTRVAGDAGSITLIAKEGALLDGAMKAGVTAESAAAGKFDLILEGMTAKDRTDPNMTGFPIVPWQILVQAGGVGSFVTQAGLKPNDDSKAGTADLTAVDGKAYVDAQALQAAGFDQIKFSSSNGSIILGNTVALQARRSVMLDAPEIRVAGSAAGSNASIAAGYVNLANTDQNSQAIAAPLAGNGALNISAQLVDMTGNLSVSGINKLGIASTGDLRLNSAYDRANKTLHGALRTQADLTLQAAQIYPSTLSQYKLSVEDAAAAPAGKITLLPAASGPAPLLSAGGQLTLSAANIEQNGVLKAPMGTLNLNATQNLTLSSGSVTSVSGEGMTIPFGLIQGGKTWQYDMTGAGDYATITAPPQKQVKLSGTNINVAKNAEVNLSGGGDLYGYEFFAGTGGSKDVLNPANFPANTFAILPSLNAAFSPYDTQYLKAYEQPGSKAFQMGSTVYLAGGNGLAAGYYTLLPAQYALLPGAYTVTQQAGYQDWLPERGVVPLLNGTQIMAGKFGVAGTAIADARWSGFAVTPGSVARTQSEYHDSYANNFFTAQAAANGTLTPLLPVDAGKLVVTANGAGATLALDGTFNAQHGAGGRGAQVDLNVTGAGFDIVNGARAPNGLVQLDVNALNKIGAESLLIGGVRSQTETGTSITAGATQVIVENAGSSLSGAEIILAATDVVTLKTGSDIQAGGTYYGKSGDIALNGNGALLRVANAPQVAVTRTAANGATGVLTVENGAKLGGLNNALLLDASQTTSIGNSALLQGSAFSVSAQNIDVGNSMPAAASLNLSSGLLAQLANFRDITLHSYNDLNLYGAAALGGMNAQGGYAIDRLTLDARSINGLNNAGMTNGITARNIELRNSNGDAVTAAVYGAGNLRLNADRIVLAEGNKSVHGFDRVELAAQNEISGRGTGTLNVKSGDSSAHSLVLKAGQITGASKSDQSVVAKNYDVAIQRNTGTSLTTGDTLGAKFALSGKSIADSGVINLPSGSITLHATGTAATDGVVLAAGSRTIARDLSKTIAGKTAWTNAGSILLSADAGGVTQEKGAEIDVSATAGGDAGTLAVNAKNGAVSLSGSVLGSALASAGNTPLQGTFLLDAGSLSGGVNAFSALNNMLNSGGLTEKRDMRIRTGDVVLAADAGGVAAVTARTFHVAADTGNIDVYGTVNSAGATGGDILLAANKNVTLHSGGLLDAHATDGISSGGKVTLETAAGEIDLMSGPNVSAIDVHGAGNTGGQVWLRAPQNLFASDVAVNNVAGTALQISPGANLTIEAFKEYAATSRVSYQGKRTSVYFIQANSFINNNVAAIKGRLGIALTDGNAHLLPGVQINSAGNMMLTTDWDLSTWRFDNGTGALVEPGVLTLRAAHDLTFGDGTKTASLSDGVKSTNPATATNSAATTTGFTLTNDKSWSYRLIAGADGHSADVMAVNGQGTGSINLVAGNQVTIGAKTVYTMEQIRTGTGFIDIAAGGNLNLGNKDSVIYTVGQSATGLPASLAGVKNKQFMVNGGDININVKGNINGALTNQLITDWLWRQGSTNGTFAELPAWWVNLASFQQNIGALGGGNVNVSAGGNITNLSAVAPTTGYAASLTAPVTVFGGGNVSVKAGGDINSGVFYVGKGLGTIQAGGSLGTSRVDQNNLPIYTILALGQGNFDVRAAGDLNLQTVVNPTVLSQGNAQKDSKGGMMPFLRTKNYFFTYGDNAGVTLSSLLGNILLSNNTSIFTDLVTGNGFYLNSTMDRYMASATVYPGTLKANALSGNVTINNTLTLFPSTSGNLQLTAAGDVLFNGTFAMSDAALAGLQASTSVSSFSSTLQPVLNSGHSALHAQDTTPVSINAGGSVIADSRAIGWSATLTLPKSAHIQAGVDVRNLSLSVQNQSSEDTTSVVAGRDVVYTPIASQESLTTLGLSLAGPGQMLVQAGRNVDLGQSAGLLSKGNLSNLLLPEQGADITVLAGVGQGNIATQSFINQYINPANSTVHSADLISFTRQHGAPANLSAAGAFAYFGNLPVSLQNILVNQVLFKEVNQAGRDGISTGNYSAGYDAIAALFPAGSSQGDISLYYSQIKTERGGNISLLAPEGGVNAGLANPSQSGPQKTAAQLGIVSVKGGDVSAVVGKDFAVNQSRVFTLQGGDLLIWSSYGNIDAGKGSKTVTATPPPLLVVDPKTGNFVVDVSQSVAGSGIRGSANVYLYAPSGEINAGDAGIGAGAGFWGGARTIIGADNITVAGASAGLPVASAGVGVSGMSNVQDASKAADQVTQKATNENDTARSMKDFKPTFLSVDVIGLGDENLTP